MFIPRSHTPPHGGKERDYKHLHKLSTRRINHAKQIIQNISSDSSEEILALKQQLKDALNGR